MAETIILERFAYAPDGTFGRLMLPDGWQCFTCERPWKGNARGESCIPEGVYDLRHRRSPVVERTSAGAYQAGWEVADVPDRAYIMIHPANWPNEVEGCIAVGREYLIMRGRNGVSHSRDTFRDLMRRVVTSHAWRLAIQPYRVEYP